MRDRFRCFRSRNGEASIARQWREALQLGETVAEEGLSAREVRFFKVLAQSRSARWQCCLSMLLPGVASTANASPTAGRSKRPSARGLQASMTALAWRATLQLREAARRFRVALPRRRVLYYGLAAVAFANGPSGSLLEQRQARGAELSWIRSSSLLAGMRRQALRPSRRGLAAHLAALARNSPWRQALQALRRRDVDGIQEDKLTGEMLMKGLSLSQSWQVAPQLLEVKPEWLRSRRVASTAVHIARGRRWWEKMARWLDDAAVSQRAVLEARLAGCARTLELRKAQALLRQAVAREVRISGAAHSFVMHAAALSKKWLTSIALYQALRHEGNRPSEATVNNIAIALRLVRPNWPSIQGLLEHMHSEALRSNAIFLGNAIQGATETIYRYTVGRTT